MKSRLNHAMKSHIQSRIAQRKPLQNLKHRVWHLERQVEDLMRRAASSSALIHPSTCQLPTPPFYGHYSDFIVSAQYLDPSPENEEILNSFLIEQDPYQVHRLPLIYSYRRRGVFLCKQANDQLPQSPPFPDLYHGTAPFCPNGLLYPYDHSGSSLTAGSLSGHSRVTLEPAPLLPEAILFIEGSDTSGITDITRFFEVYIRYLFFIFYLLHEMHAPSDVPGL
jgi:hypothetical protein